MVFGRRATHSNLESLPFNFTESPNFAPDSLGRHTRYKDCARGMERAELGGTGVLACKGKDGDFSVGVMRRSESERGEGCS